jgi:hypothetical protein
MAYSIFYFDEVEMDIKEARLWYKATDEKLENRFVQAIENAIKITRMAKSLCNSL